MLGAERGGIPAEASIWTLKADRMDVNLMSPTSWGWPSHRFARQGLCPHPWVKPPLHGDNTAKQLKPLSNRWRPSSSSNGKAAVKKTFSGHDVYLCCHLYIMVLVWVAGKAVSNTHSSPQNLTSGDSFPFVTILPGRKVYYFILGVCILCVSRKSR